MTSDKIINRCTTFQTKPFSLILYSGLKQIILWLLMSFNDDEVSRESEKNPDLNCLLIYKPRHIEISHGCTIQNHLINFFFFGTLDHDSNSEN